MNKLRSIMNQIQDAQAGERTVTIHYLAFKNAKEFEGVDLSLFCKEAKLPQSYQTEIRKMIALSKYTTKREGRAA